MSLLANSNAIESGGYNIDRSLRFRSSASAYLSRTPASSSNQKTFTISLWTKRGALSVDHTLFCARQLSVSTPYFFIGFNASTDILSLNADTCALYTTQVFRDPSAWYHILYAVDTTQATSSNRIKLYINGTQVTTFGTATYPSLNADTGVNSAILHQIGAVTNGIGSRSQYFDGYLAEVNFIDGQALTPSSFGETDTTTGVWVPKKYTGTYGTNGFYLDFKDNTSATTLAYDKSGNGNNWTANNISTTAGSTYDSMTDVPTLTSATAANFAVLNPINKGPNGTISNANLLWSAAQMVGGSHCGCSTIAMSSGKWYAEVTPTGAEGQGTICGIMSATDNVTTLGYPGYTSSSYGYAGFSGKKYNNQSATSYGATFTAGDVIGVAFDADNGTLTFYKNGTSQGVAYSSIPAGTYVFGAGNNSASNIVQAYFNFGQRPFSYTPPTGFVALNTFNLPDPTIKKPNQYMDATLYTGTGSALSVVNAGAFQPSLVWAKARSTTTNNNLYDAVRGTGKILVSNNTDAEVDVGSLGLSAFNSNGFSLGTGSTLNDSGQTYVGWQWKESATAGFDIVTYTGTGSALNVNHSLGVAPKFIIVKDRSASNPWPTYHASLGSQYYTLLNATSAADNSLSNYWGASGPSSTTFTVGPYGGNNTNGNNYVAYLFAEIAGFSKFGSYTGNGSTDGPFVYCGFRPKYVMFKRTDQAAQWDIVDTTRNANNVVNARLYANLSNAEDTAGTPMDILSNGFKMKTTDVTENASGGTYIYAAFAENPFKYSNAR